MVVALPYPTLIESFVRLDHVPCIAESPLVICVDLLKCDIPHRYIKPQMRT